MKKDLRTHAATKTFIFENLLQHVEMCRLVSATSRNAETLLVILIVKLVWYFHGCLLNRVCLGIK